MPKSNTKHQKDTRSQKEQQKNQLPVVHERFVRESENNESANVSMAKYFLSPCTHNANGKF